LSSSFLFYFSLPHGKTSDSPWRFSLLFLGKDKPKNWFILPCQLTPVPGIPRNQERKLPSPLAFYQPLGKTFPDQATFPSDSDPPTPPVSESTGACPRKIPSWFSGSKRSLQRTPATATLSFPPLTIFFFFPSFFHRPVNNQKIFSPPPYSFPLPKTEPVPQVTVAGPPGCLPPLDSPLPLSFDVRRTEAVFLDGGSDFFLPLLPIFLLIWIRF